MKNVYRTFCASHTALPLFFQDWWLDAVSGDSWDVCIVKDGDDNIEGILPYVINKRYGKTFLSMPPLTQYLGPWIMYPLQQKYTTALHHEKEVLSKLIELLPTYHSYSQQWHYEQKNWLPFYWTGFSQTTRYTYRLTITSKDTMWKGFRENIRRAVRKAEKTLHVEVSSDMTLLYDMVKKTYARQHRRVPFSKQILEEIHSATNTRKQSQLYLAKNSDDEVKAAVYIVWDNTEAYYILGGATGDARTNGAQSLLLWHALQHLPNHIQTFNFEGSMVPSIERFFRSFGAKQTQYFAVKKQRGILRRLSHLKSAISRPE